MIRDYPKYKPFRFWCQKVLPLVYDDSLSYYELLNKVVDYLNNVIKDVTALGTAFEELSTMVTDYFENLDVQEEIDNKLDSMVEDGTLDAMIQPLVGDAVSEWLEDNVTPTGSAVLVDSTLTISGAAADAKVTGDEISDLKSDLNYNTKILGTDWQYGFIKSSDGLPSIGGTDRLFSRFIPCPPKCQISYIAETNHSSVNGISFYNKFTTYISGYANNGTIGEVQTVTSPANTAYLRISTKVSIKESTELNFNGNNNQVLAWLQRQISNTTIYVDGITGNDTTGIGTTSSPFKTIGRAINQGAPNICVTPGTYNEQVTISFFEFIHIYANTVNFNSTSITDRPKVIIDGNSTIENPLLIQYCRDVYLDDIVVQNSASGSKGCIIERCENLHMQNCEFNNNGHDGCVINYTNGVIRDCKANENGNDGFNMNYFGDTQFYNCSGHDNADDGISHHQGTTGCINGGEWYNNGKGGVASPAHGAQVDILNIYSHDNAYGIYANADSDTVARTFHVWNSVLVNNSQYGLTSKRNTCYLYNCKISGNTAGQTTAPSGGHIYTLD